MPPNPYPTELIEAAEKEYPYLNGDGLHKIQANQLRAAYIKGLSLAMPLVEALEKIKEHKGDYDINLFSHAINTIKNMVSIADKAIANFPQNDIINSHKNKKQ